MGDEWVQEQNLKFQKAEAIMNAPLHLAPLLAPFYARSTPHRTVIHRGNKQLVLGGQKGGHTFLQRNQLNRSKKLFLDDLDLQRFENARNITPTFTPPQKVSGTGNQAIKPGFVTDASGQLVSPGYDTGYQSFLQRGRNPTHYNIASQAKNMFNGGSVEGGAIGDILQGTSPTGLTVSKENIAPGFQPTQSEITEVIKIHEEFKGLTKSGKRLGEKELSIGSTIGSMGQKKSFNLSPIEKAETVDRAVGGTIIKEIPGKRGTRREISAEIENIPYKELHHIFGKAPGEKIISNVWKLINEDKATVEDLINLNYWAKSKAIGLGDFGAEAVNRVPHSRTHSRSRAFGREMTSKEIKAIPEFNNIDDLTSYFRETLETRVIQMRGELDIQQGIYNQLPKKTRIEVEQLKVAKEKASRNLTDRYKKIYGETMPDTPPEVKDAYQTHIWIQKDLNVTDSKLIKLAVKLDQARKIQDDQMARVVKQLEQLETEELSSLDRRAIKTSRPGKETSARAQEKIDYSQVRDETDTYGMLTGKEQFW